MRKTSLWIVWIVLLVIYFATTVELCREGQYWPLVFAVLNVACGVFLFFAEGFEVAFCMLWPMRESTEPGIQNMFQGLDSEFILAQRQVIVVVTITVVSLTTGAIESLFIPGLGRVQSYGVPEIFSLAFVTCTILWFCQVFPKRVAARDPVRFWKFSQWLLGPIKVAGRILDLPAPSDDLVVLWDASFSHVPCPSSVMESPWMACECDVCNPSLAVNIPCSCPVCTPTDLGLQKVDQAICSGIATERCASR